MRPSWNRLQSNLQTLTPLESHQPRSNGTDLAVRTYARSTSDVGGYRDAVLESLHPLGTSSRLVVVTEGSQILEPREGLEPPTSSLISKCSFTELPRLICWRGELLPLRLPACLETKC
jgi:hypothetical protein